MSVCNCTSILRVVEVHSHSGHEAWQDDDGRWGSGIEELMYNINLRSPNLTKVNGIRALRTIAKAEVRNNDPRLRKDIIVLAIRGGPAIYAQQGKRWSSSLTRIS